MDREAGVVPGEEEARAVLFEQTGPLEQADDLAARPASAQALVLELEARLEQEEAPSFGRLLRRPAWAAGLAGVLLAGTASGAWFLRSRQQERWARREALPEIRASPSSPIASAS